MAERKIDALVMQNNNDWLGGYVRWFTDTPLSNGYPRSVIFPASDLMTVVDMGARGRAPQARRRATRSTAASARCSSRRPSPRVAYTDEYQAELVADELKRRGYRTIGWVGSGAMPHNFVARDRAASLPGKAEIRRCDRIRRPPQGDQERGGNGAHPQLRGDAGRDLRARAARRSSPA